MGHFRQDTRKATKVFQGIRPPAAIKQLFLSIFYFVQILLHDTRKEFRPQFFIYIHNSANPCSANSFQAIIQKRSFVLIQNNNKKPSLSTFMTNISQLFILPKIHFEEEEQPRPWLDLIAYFLLFLFLISTVLIKRIHQHRTEIKKKFKLYKGTTVKQYFDLFGC